jgi:hypothetical protein
MICVIGSHAINEACIKLKGMPYRRPMDLDIVCSESEAIAFAESNFATITEQYPSKKGGKLIFKGTNPKLQFSGIIEAELVTDDSTAKALRDIILSDPETTYKNGMAYASIDVCYMLKMSHRYLKNNPHFLKTMRDIHNLRKLGAKIRKEHKPFLKERERVTYWYKHPKLNQNKQEFFNGDGVPYVFDHDSIHESVKLGDKPAYSYFQTDGAEVMVDMKKFFSIDEQIRLNAVYEESAVLALERSIIPFGTNYERAFLMALEKVCTSITSGKFREFAYENYGKVRAMFSDRVFDRFFEHVANDMVDSAKKAA